MKDDPYKADWIHLVKEDLEVINFNLENEEEIAKRTTEEFKVLVKRKVRDAAFKELEEIKAEQIKVKHRKHTNILKPQKYLVSDKLDNKGKSDLFNLRSESHRMFRDNSHNLFNTNDCPMCGKEADR